MASATSSLAERAAEWSRGGAGAEVLDPIADPDPAELVAMAVHDMKTPLAALRQALQLVTGGRAGEVTAGQHRFLAMAMDNAHALGSLLDRLQGTIGGRTSADDLRPQRMDAEAAAAFVVRALQASAEVRGVALELRCSAGLDDAWADPVLIRRVLLNLVANALKYAGKGGIATVIVERLPEDSGLVVLRVRDRGPGIPADEHEAVFGARRRSESTCGGQEGAGLGLAIVREIARAHGGHAWVTNNAGSGCTFSVSVPAFGSGRGAGRQVQLAARASAAVAASVELTVLRARPGKDERLADTLAGGLPAGWRLADLGAGRLGLLRPVPENGTWGSGSAAVSALLGGEDLVDELGWAAARAADIEPERLIAAACAALEPIDSRTASRPGRR